MPVSFISRLKMSLFGSRYSLTRVVPILLLRKFGMETSYSKVQLEFVLKELNLDTPKNQATALALFGEVRKQKNCKELYRIRDGFGLNGEGALEVFKEYCKIEKYSSDPYGSDQAKRTTTGGASAPM